MIGIFFLDQGGVQAAGDENIAEGEKDGHDADDAVIIRHQNSCKDNGNHQRYKLGTDALGKFPQHAAECAFFDVLGIPEAFAPSGNVSTDAKIVQ